MSDMLADPPDKENVTYVGPEPAAPAQFDDADATSIHADAAPTEPPDDADVFPREYVEKLRKEAAGYRTQVREYENIFGDLDDDSRELLTDYFRTANAAANGDQDAQRRLVEEFGVDDADDDEDVAQVAQDTGLTEESVRAMIAEALGQRDQHEAQQQAIQSVQSRAKDLGYDTASEDYILLLRFANESAVPEDTDPLVWADEQVKAYKDSIVQAYLAEKEGQTGPRVSTPGAAPSTAAGPPVTFEEARERLGERLGARAVGA